jgi:hypothetical protein
MDNIKMDLGEIEWGGVNGLVCLRITPSEKLL